MFSLEIRKIIFELISSIPPLILSSDWTENICISLGHWVHFQDKQLFYFHLVPFTLGFSPLLKKNIAPLGEESLEGFCCQGKKAVSLFRWMDDL